SPATAAIAADAPPGLDLRPARLAASRLLSGAGSGKEVREFTVDVAGSGLAHGPGDVLVIEPVNAESLVDEWLAVLGADPATAVCVSGAREPIAFADALRTRLEIATPSMALLRFVAARSGDRQLSRMLHATGDIELEKWLFGRQAIDVVAGCPIVATPQEWVDVLRPLARRRYSIASSPLADPSRLRIVVSIVSYDGPSGVLRQGVCSAHLTGAEVGAELRVAITSTPRFRPPEDPSAAMIMIGPGTGIAPFLGFLEHRRAQGATGRSWLFFGEQHEGSDHYYREELGSFIETGALTRLDTAFSRDQRAKIYVQDRMAQHGKELWGWLEAGAYLYVCGDAKRMASDVDRALREIVARHGGLDAPEADAYVKRLSTAGRYVRDIY
ncbi:MAG: molybdopterin oxidoreductase, partial [Jatrophihabitantaceae bacterium]|nr:molybdopterin oxidoreductase [Jatrophihabitantaceae bacterium]